MLNSASEIYPGIVILMDSRKLHAGCVTVPTATAFRYKSHFCLCLEIEEETGVSYWLPFFSVDGENRGNIAETEKDGHRKWKDGISYYHPDQIWALTSAAAIRASEGDLSIPANRNTVVASTLARLRTTCAAALGRARALTPC